MFFVFVFSTFFINKAALVPESCSVDDPSVAADFGNPSYPSFSDIDIDQIAVDHLRHKDYYNENVYAYLDQMRISLNFLPNIYRDYSSKLQDSI